ncbi:hypothetical protein NDU88_006589 [Pleurodeles waltl]|uniref:Uncharacterized protein n=1 Tax=Pleurodeles waltl TaxID=8319 RepID=A0AAV7PRS0_PLEWA|nr:hypothetical protein NDU88_006589 [Pleurodeles waltl]
MLQLILDYAVNCEQKQEYIQTIMMMEESVQHVVMTAIQKLMSKEIPVSVGNDGYSLLDGAKVRKNGLVNQRLLEAQSQEEELQKSLQDKGSKDSLLLKMKLEEHFETLHEANNELLKKRAIIEYLEPRYNKSSLKIEELQDALKRKEDEIK